MYLIPLSSSSSLHFFNSVTILHLEWSIILKGRIINTHTHTQKEGKTLSDTVKNPKSWVNNKKSRRGKTNERTP